MTEKRLIVYVDKSYRITKLVGKIYCPTGVKAEVGTQEELDTIINDEQLGPDRDLEVDIEDEG